MLIHIDFGVHFLLSCVAILMWGLSKIKILQGFSLGTYKKVVSYIQLILIALPVVIICLNAQLRKVNILVFFKRDIFG